MQPSSQPPAARVTALVAAVALVWIVLVSTTVGADPAPAPESFLADRPYVPLFSETNNCYEVRTLNSLPVAELDARLAALTRWYRHFHAEGSNHFHLGTMCQGSSSTTLAAKLSARGAWTSNYRNGSYVSQSSARNPLNFGEAPDLEASAPLSIATFWPGNSRPWGKGDDTVAAARLAGGLDAGSTIVRVNRAAAYGPAGAPATWPYVASRGAGAEPGAHSRNTHDFVSWIRIGDELMQVLGPPTEAGGVVTLSVRRGLWGTAAAPHAAGSRVMSPVYIGSTSAVASDANLNGSPARDDADYPLRYGIKIWQPGGHGWIAARIRATFGPAPDFQGYDTVWLDVSSCSQYNNADPYGQPVAGWDDPLGTKLTQARWGQHQKTKLAGLRRALPSMRFTGNNLGGRNAGPCTDDLIANAYDGGVLEHWMKHDGHWSLDWESAMAQSLRIQAGDWPALYWVRWAYDFQGSPEEYKRFSYGSLLLAYRPTATRFQYGGPWGLSRPDELYFWDWGAPRSTPSSTGELAVGSTGLHRRDFEHGVVLVNPGTAAVTYELGTTHYDVVQKDASGRPRPVTEITVGARDAAFLLRGSAGGTTTTSTSTSTTSPPPTTLAPDTADPDTTLEAPAPGSEFEGAVRMSGTASDDRGVDSVRVAMRNEAGEWLQDDGSWGRYASRPAVVADPGASTTAWAHEWVPVPPGAYLLTAVARDAAGNYDRSAAWTTVTIVAGDATDPETTIDSPASGSSHRIGTSISLGGHATDDRGVARVNVGIRDTASGAWWQWDGTWGPEYAPLPATLEAPGAPSTAWSVRWEAPAEGRFVVSAVALDTSGNRDHSSAWAWFDVTAKHPNWRGGRGGRRAV